ncbi:MAG: hypothetical protein ACOH2V_00400 [Candidatus Saccharimonadaceae bacterium]
MVSIPVIWIIICILILHTVLTHLLNWAWRGALPLYNEEPVLTFFLALIEIIGVLYLLSTIIK